MRRHLRINVAERRHLIVPVDHRRGYLPTDDLAKQAVGIRHGAGHDRSPKSYSTSAARTGDAVSVRSTRGPSVTTAARARRAQSTSSGAKPPSGPTNTDTAGGEPASASRSWHSRS